MHETAAAKAGAVRIKAEMGQLKGPYRKIEKTYNRLLECIYDRQNDGAP